MKTITEADIKDKLCTHCCYSTKRFNECMSLRNLHKQVNYDCYNTIGSIFYSLSGSPPRGYAIVIPEIRRVNLYGHRGKRFRILRDTVVKEVQDLNLTSPKEGVNNDKL